MGARRGALTDIDTLVLQSHRQPLPAPWLSRCLASVRSWAADSGFGYEFIDDALFDGVPEPVLENTEQRLTARSDLGRLLRCIERLERDVDRVVWLDADILIFRPEALVLPESSFAVGRECWLDVRSGKSRVGRAVHNAVLMFQRENPFLEFYRWSAEHMLARHNGPMVPQLVGPKLLTLLHNAIELPVIESVGVASPDLISELALGRQGALELVARAHGETLAALNLSSSVAADVQTMELAIDYLVATYRHR